MVARMSVAWTTDRRSSARVRSSRRKPSRHDQSRMYAFGAYWFWMPPMRSSARGIGEPDALEQQLSSEERAVQLALREGALRHGLDAIRAGRSARACGARSRRRRAHRRARARGVTGSSSTIAPITHRKR